MKTATNTTTNTDEIAYAEALTALETALRLVQSLNPQSAKSKVAAAAALTSLWATQDKVLAAKEADAKKPAQRIIWRGN